MHSHLIGDDRLLVLNEIVRLLLLLLLLLQESNRLIELGIGFRELQDTLLFCLQFNSENFHLATIRFVQNTFDDFVGLARREELLSVLFRQDVLRCYFIQNQLQFIG